MHLISSSVIQATTTYMSHVNKGTSEFVQSDQYFCCSIIGEFCLVHMLIVRHQNMIFQHFMECIFHFNDYKDHAGKVSVMQTVRRLQPGTGCSQ